MVLSFFQSELKIATHTACTKKKYVKLRTFDTFLRRVIFILMFFQEQLASLLSVGKPFSSDLEG